MKEIKILLVEDDVDHVELITEILKKNGIMTEIILLKNGQEAIDYFHEDSLGGINVTHSEVDLIILDLKLPKVDGMNVLKFLKKNQRYSVIPVIILSTTSEESVIEEGYKYGVNSFITKPISYDEFVEKIIILKKYWLNTCTLPSCF